MSFESRNGKRSTRAERTNRRKPELGYYLIVTDTEATERLYFNGLRDSLRDTLGDKLIIRVVETENRNMIKEAKEFLSELPQFAEPWIVFDRDKIKNFDKLIQQAEDLKIGVAWSNPCIEIWFNAYFGKMPYSENSVNCCKDFAREFKKNVGQEYQKTDKKIYDKLYTYGNEELAIEIADLKIKEHISKCNCLPSEMVPGTTLHILLKEIKSKI